MKNICLLVSLFVALSGFAQDNKDFKVLAEKRGTAFHFKFYAISNEVIVVEKIWLLDGRLFPSVGMPFVLSKKYKDGTWLYDNMCFSNREVNTDIKILDKVEYPFPCDCQAMIQYRIGDSVKYHIVKSFVQKKANPIRMPPDLDRGINEYYRKKSRH